MSKCRCCDYSWVPCGHFLSPRDGRLFMTDVGICPKCGNAKSRLRIATPGDQLSAMLWGQQFEVSKVPE